MGQVPRGTGEEVISANNVLLSVNRGQRKNRERKAQFYLLSKTRQTLKLALEGNMEKIYLWIKGRVGLDTHDWAFSLWNQDCAWWLQVTKYIAISEWKSHQNFLSFHLGTGEKFQWETKMKLLCSSPDLRLRKGCRKPGPRRSVPLVWQRQQKPRQCPGWPRPCC